MRVSEAVKLMSKSYLNRIVDSFTKDFTKESEAQSQDIIVKNVNELADQKRIKNLIQIYEESYDKQILQSYVLEALLEQPEYIAEESVIINTVQEVEKAILKESQSENCFQFTDSHDLDILRTVLDVAIDDSILSKEELRLIRHLRQRLGLSEKDQFLLLAQLNHYPREGNKIHTSSDCRDILLNLQKKGVVFYCNHLENGPAYVIPVELIPGVRSAIGFELTETAHSLLLNNLQVNQLSTVLDGCGVTKSGTKEDLIQRIINIDIQPSQVLNFLSNNELYALCKKLPGTAVSGLKEDRIERIIDYYDNLVIKPSSESTDEGEFYYDYLKELAIRDRKNLLTYKVIKKDKEMEKAFEIGTKYLFTKKLKLTLEELSGNDIPDGCIP
ncbi:MAG: hypothetical protein GF313_00125, partial [Caldithrix sp.]|nr:hypothetical protein [Caldithrix sp.]